MVKTFYGILLSIILIVVGLLVMGTGEAGARQFAQQPTVSVPTVTGTPQGASIRVNADNEQINVRTGPGTDYDSIGVLIAGQVVPALGRSAGGSWIQIKYAGVASGVGWVYSPLVTLIEGGDLPVVEPPPTATPRVTPTIDPTLASQFIVESQPTRLPTFTAPPPLVVPTYVPVEPATFNFGIPIGLVIVILGTLGLLGLLASIIRGR
ncbi:MAG: SH3 domain-containing protein [Anaerolineales bacterium]|nr:SH3 domain-containing protein [Anaerolineales bacterium]